MAEVANTPWGERHLYVLDDASNIHPDRRWRRFQFSKEFHISPFMPMNIDYDWRFSVPGDRLNVHLMNFKDGKQVFDATLNLSRQADEPAEPHTDADSLPGHDRQGRRHDLLAGTQTEAQTDPIL